MKHFTKGVILGRITEIKDETTKQNNKKYITLTVDISSSLSGDVTAYCRMYDKDDNTDEIKKLWKANRQGLFKLQGMYSQYRKDESSDFMSNFTLWSFEPVTEGKKRAYFIVVGEVSHQPSGTNDGGQRFLCEVSRENNDPELYEFWAPGEKLMDSVSVGNLVRVKGMLRQRDPDGLCGGEGPIHAYLESLEIITQGDDSTGDDLPY